MKWLAAAPLLFATSACFNEFLVEPDPNVAPQFFAAVDVRQGEGISYIVFGNLRPGTDAHGNGRALVDSSMTVDGSAIQGTPNVDGSRLIYRWADSTTQTVRDTIAVKGPTLADQTAPTAIMLIPVAARLDAATRDVPAGQDISLNFTALGEAPYGFGSGQGLWRLEIAEEGQPFSLVTLQGRSPPTSPIVIPSQLLPTVAGDSLVATLTLNSNFESVLTAYRTLLGVFTRLEWRMRIVAPAVVR
jgi:hypothetical protein